MAREHGVPDAVVDAIGRGEDPPFAADDERTVHAIARSLVDTRLGAGRRSTPPGRRCSATPEWWSWSSLCGYYTLISFLLNAFDVPLPPGSAPMWPASRG